MQLLQEFCHKLKKDIQKTDDKQIFTGRFIVRCYVQQRRFRAEQQR